MSQQEQNRITNNIHSEQSLLTFSLAGEIYGLPVTAVVQIIEMVAITRLPHTPASIQGIINVRGEIVLVIDLRRHFELPVAPYGLHTPIIIVETGSQLLALVVDEVQEVITVPGALLSIQQEQLSNEADFIDRLPYLAGLARLDNRLLPLLNPAALLPAKAKQWLAEAVPPAEEGLPA